MEDNKVIYPAIAVDLKGKVSTVIRKRFEVRKRKNYYLKEVSVLGTDIPKAIHELHKKVYLTLMLENLDGSWLIDLDQTYEVTRLKDEYLK